MGLWLGELFGIEAQRGSSSPFEGFRLEHGCNLCALWALIVACVLYGMPLNVVHLIVNEFQKSKLGDSLFFLVPSLITEVGK
ncbi:hypothetical protein H5410_002583 [Solanum commersonii]|uniref:Uncharacterized protein n=1 Tax=Solanum commersonii TaxID=4109 RepID=A0A9J6B2P8_SOLCO|nr:hypothetical protein H5410_002583 [Solanum commersonii]